MVTLQVSIPSPLVQRLHGRDGGCVTPPTGAAQRRRCGHAAATGGVGCGCGSSQQPRLRHVWHVFPLYFLSGVSFSALTAAAAVAADSRDDGSHHTTRTRPPDPSKRLVSGEPTSWAPSISCAGRTSRDLASMWSAVSRQVPPLSPPTRPTVHADPTTRNSGQLGLARPRRALMAGLGLSSPRGARLHPRDPRGNDAARVAALQATHTHGRQYQLPETPSGEDD